MNRLRGRRTQFRDGSLAVDNVAGQGHNRLRVVSFATEREGDMPADVDRGFGVWKTTERLGMEGEDRRRGAAAPEPAGYAHETGWTTGTSVWTSLPMTEQQKISPRSNTKRRKGWKRAEHLELA